jgi:hypothetical protein
MAKKNLATIFFLSFSFFIFSFSFSSAQIDLPSSLLMGQQQTAPTIKISTNDLVLVWSANTYVPPGYQGKALPTYDSMVKVSAMPISKAGTNLDGVIYNWYLDDSQGATASGEKAKDFLFKTNAATGTFHSVALKIMDSSSNVLLALTVYVPVVSPTVALNIEDTKTADALSSAAEPASIPPGGNAAFIATPYFFNISNPLSLNYQWTFDNDTINKTEEKNKFSVKIADGDLTEAFTKTLSVLAVNPFNEIERAVGNIEITIQK